MRKILFKKQLSLIIIAVLAIITLIGWIVWNKNNNITELENTQTLNQGTQMRFGELSIGLSSINDKSALLVIHKENMEDSISKSVVAGDEVAIYGYIIRVSSVEKSANPSTLPGSSHGYIKFTINLNE